MDQIANLVIDLSIDSAEFRNEVPRIKKLLNDAAGDSERSAARMQRFLDKQTEATRRTSASLEQVTASSTAYSSAVEKSAAASTRLAADVDQTRQRVEALGRKLREEQAQSAAVAAAQDRTSAAFYRQIDSVKQLSGGLQELQRIQAQVRQAKGRGDISQGDYLALVSETARKTRELTDAEALATQKKAQFIRRLKEQTTVQGLSRTELLRVKAAELGVSSAADIYIRKLERTGTATHTLGLKSAAARRELGVLAGELARGNFGALRGSGITLANRAGWIEQLMSPKGMMLGGLAGGVAAAVYGLGKAYYEGAKESEAFNKQLILTGSYAGKTTGQLNAMAKSQIGWPSITVFSSSDYKRVALTDYDRFPEDIDGEGDGFSLASKRTTTFMSAGMTLAESSSGREITDVKWRRSSPHEAPPTTGILSLYNRGDRRRWYWPCPHCGDWFQPIFCV